MHLGYPYKPLCFLWNDHVDSLTYDFQNFQEDNRSSKYKGDPIAKRMPSYHNIGIKIHPWFIESK